VDATSSPTTVNFEGRGNFFFSRDFLGKKNMHEIQFVSCDILIENAKDNIRQFFIFAFIR
jgi:hypothetical protein